MKKLIIAVILLTTTSVYAKTIDINPVEVGKAVAETTYKVATFDYLKIATDTVGNIIKVTLHGLSIPFYWLEKIKK